MGKTRLTNEFQLYAEGEGAIFLINTGRPRRTEPLVNLFLEKCKNSDFSAKCSDVLLPVTNLCIESFLEKRINELTNSFKILSALSLDQKYPAVRLPSRTKYI